MVEPMTMTRYGMWSDIVVLPDDDADHVTRRLFCIYAKSIAYAALGRVDEARAHQARFESRLNDVPPNHRLHNETVANIAAVSHRVIEAEILYRMAPAKDEWMAELSRAKELESALAYDEPPAYMIPVHQTFGALLSESGRHVQAIGHFSADLQMWPKNAWSLAGLRTALVDAQLVVKRQYAEASQHMDVAVTTACACATRHVRRASARRLRWMPVAVAALAVAILVR